MSTNLRSSLIRLAHEHPEFRDQLLPILKEAADNPTEADEKKRRAENSKRSIEMSNDIRSALKAKGWKFTQGHSDANILAYDHEESMNFEHEKLGTLSVKFYVNNDGN